MKSVIINLKYLIFRSASASEGGSLEERRWEGGGGWKESCCSISLICIRYVEANSNRSTDCFFFFFSGLHLLFWVHLWAICSRAGGHIQFHFCASRFGFSIGLCHLSPISKLHLQPSALAPERLRALVIRCEACLTLTDKPALTMPVPAAW